MEQTQATERYLLTADNIRIDRELHFAEDHINAYIETWFDVDRRFDINTYGTPNYINVYANYYPAENRLTVEYIIIYNDDIHDKDQCFEVKDLAASERELIIRLMNDRCKEGNHGLDMIAAFKKFNEEY